MIQLNVGFFLLHEYVVLRHCQIYDVAVLTLPHGKGEQPSFHYESMQLLLNAIESINLIRIFITKAMVSKRMRYRSWVSGDGIII